MGLKKQYDLVSIPTGAIKAVHNTALNVVIVVVSIPTGAIKAERRQLQHGATTAFQFRQVRLKLSINVALILAGVCFNSDRFD